VAATGTSQDQLLLDTPNNNGHAANIVVDTQGNVYTPDTGTTASCSSRLPVWC
jgi:hypothetical protein